MELYLVFLIVMPRKVDLYLVFSVMPRNVDLVFSLRPGKVELYLPGKSYYRR